MLVAARSWLFVPGTRPDRFAKAIGSGADVVVVDLEDAVAPSEKEEARAAVAAWLDPGRAVVVRVNADPEMMRSDLDAIRREGLLAVMLPKAENPAQLAAVAASLPEQVGLVPLVETARGVCLLAAVAATTGVTRLAFGRLDLALDLGVDPDAAGGTLPAAGHLVVLHSRGAGLPPPVAGVTTDARDLVRLASDVAGARADGFSGKLCIHPRQVAAVNVGFAPTAEETDWALRVIEAAATRPGAFLLEGQMVDRPVLERARQVANGARPPDRKDVQAWS